MLKNEQKERVQVVFNKENKKDMCILQYLRGTGNISGYIKELILKDMEDNT